MEDNKKVSKKPVDVILDAYVEYIYNKKGDKKNKSASKYKSVTSAFCVEDAFKSCSNATRNFLDLLPKLLCDEKYHEKLYPLIKDIKENVLNEEKYNWKDNGKRTLKSYLKQLLDFIEIKEEELKLKLKKSCNQDQLKITPTDEALLEGVDGEIYTYSVLKTKFKSRLRSQDRVSGDKIWLPLRFIAKIYSAYVKNQKNKGSEVTNDYLNWLNTLVDSIYIHFYNDKNEITHVSFGSDVSLLLNKDEPDTELYNVFVRFKDNEKFYPVFTPTGKGNQKTEMQVTGINSIAIDHVIPIDKTLRDLEDKLVELKRVSDAYKEMQEQEEPDENVTIQQLIKTLDFPVLLSNLNLIRDHGPLRLMASKYNTQKSNGETFLKILKDGDDYFGIMSEEVYYGNKKMTLYQDLKRNGYSCVREGLLNGDNIDDIKDFKIRDIIDLI